MYKEHKTADGRSLLICTMDDSHLHNTIKLYLGKIKLINDTMDGKNKAASTPSQMALMGFRKRKVDFDQLANAQERLLDKLYPYLAEACLRGLSDVTVDLQDCFARVGMQEPMGTFDNLLLEEPIDSGDEFDYEILE